MKLLDLFQNLSYGELSDLAIGSDGSGEITPANQKKLVVYTNEALLRLYSRFLLSTSDLTFEQNEAVTLYVLDAEHAMSNSSPAPGTITYINDLVTPFLDDVIRVLSVFNACGEEFPLNDSENPYSLFTPRPNVIQVPTPIEGLPLSVTYQARHPQLSFDHLDATIELPAILEPALRKYISHLTYSYMNGQENQAKSAENLRLYEAICAEVVANDLIGSSSSTTNTRFAQGGWI